MPTTATTTTLTGVSTKSGSSARGAWTLTIFTAADGGEFTTFDGGLASKASSLINQPVTIEWEIFTKKDGSTSRNLLGVEAASGAVVPQAYTEAVVQPTVASPPAKNNDQFRTKEQIMRTDALNAALTLFGIIGLDPLSAVDEFEGWYATFLNLIVNGELVAPRSPVEA